MENQDNLALYKNKAIEIFNTIKGDYSGNQRTFRASSNYWKAGNVFDTLTDYMRLALEQNMITQPEVDSIMAYVSANYNIPKYSYSATIEFPDSPQGNWYDDFAWWGIASVKAKDPNYTHVFGSLKNRFLDIAESCWSIMSDGVPNADPSSLHAWGAPNVWNKCNQHEFSSVAPLFYGGVWQNDIKKGNSPIRTDAGYQILGPYQDTVVNGLFLVLGQRLHSDYISVADLYSFIIKWCSDPKVVKDNNSLLFRESPTDGSGIILERIRVYKDGGRVEPVEWGNAHTAWCGDQGLLLGAMVDRFSSHPNDQDAATLITIILNGVAKYMTANNNVIQPWYPSENNYLKNMDCADYVSGVGVFMRYLLYGYKRNKHVKAIVDSNSPVRRMLFNSADQCLHGFYQNCDVRLGLFDYFNQLSTLTTAIEVLTAKGSDK